MHYCDTCRAATSHREPVLHRSAECGTENISAEAGERENGPVLDTSHMTLEEAVAATDRWILERLGRAPMEEAAQ